MKTFLKVLAVTVVLQFIVTRKAAGNVIEEGRAERMWMLFPVNVLLNAAMWTLLITAVGRGIRAVRRG
jgi:TRAP-type mannitol/chloroaromatic compound transport system permease small subunit